MKMGVVVETKVASYTGSVLSRSNPRGRLMKCQNRV